MRSLSESSVAAYASGLRCYGAFCKTVGLPQFDSAGVPHKNLVWYMTIFANPSTAAQYLKHLHWWCKLSGHNFPDSGVIKLAMAGLGKERAKPVKQAAYISWALTRQLMRISAAKGQWEQCYAYGLTSSCLFRAQNECLPLEIQGKHSQITFSAHSVIFDLDKRKNAQRGARIERNCLSRKGTEYCKEIFCPFHIMKAIVNRYPYGYKGQIFPSLTATGFTRMLRQDLSEAGVIDPHTYSPHGFRRGTAKEMYDRGANLAAILIAGGWRSAAYLTYLRKEQIDNDRLFECLMNGDD